jgi:hypothetical protein
MSVKVSSISIIICTILLVSTAVIPVVNAQGESNQSSADSSEVSEQNYLRGMNITTPESVGTSSTVNNGESSTRMTNLALSGLQSTPAETSGIEWQSLLGGSYGDSLFDIQQTDDGGYIAVGATGSRDGDISGAGHGSSDAWVVKFSNTGVIQWQKLYGGTRYDEALSIRQTMDGGYVFTGFTASTDGEFAANHGSDDVWVVKLDNNGNQQWQSLMGGNYSDYGNSVRQTADGGYIVAGNTFSNNIESAGSDVGGIYAARLDPAGTVLWQKAFGGSGYDFGSSIIPASDGGYILAGYSDSWDFGTSQRRGNEDVVVMKLDESGNQQWLKLLGGNGYDRTGYDNVISPTSDGGYILTAQSTSDEDGDVGFNHGSFDTWVVKLDNEGTIEWQNMFGGTSCEVIGSITQISDGGYILTAQAGSSQSGDVVEKNYGEHDIWVVRLDPSGNLLWQKLMGGNGWDQSTSIRQTTDGGYIFAGFTQSSDSGYIGTNRGYEDAWVVKLNPRLVVDVIDSDTNEPVMGATVYLYDVTNDEEQNITAINGHAAFSDSGESHQYRLINGNKYSVRATADIYGNSTWVNITYSGDGQRAIVNLTPLIAEYDNSFSITCIEHYDNIGPANGSIDECNNVSSNLIKAGYKMNFYHKDGEVKREDFHTNLLYSGLTLSDSAFHYHSGHGGDALNLSLITSLPLKGYSGPWDVGNYITAPDVFKKWGGKNKWVMLDSCFTLRDKNWGRALTTSHGIMGWTSYGSVRKEFPDKFFEYAIGDKWKIKEAYKKATIDIEQTDNMSAAIITKNKEQFLNDHFPGQGSMAPDGDPLSLEVYRRQWMCKSGNETW